MVRVDQPAAGTLRAVQLPGPQREPTTWAVRVLWVVALAGAALFALMWVLIPARGGLGLDRGAFDALASRHGAFAARAINSSASVLFWGVVLVSVAATVALARRRRWLEAGVIVAGYALAALGSNGVKALAQRPRPADPLMTAHGFAFPSSASAYAVGVLATALILASHTDARSLRVAIVALGVCAAAIAGVAMVVVRVHYFSDVLAGWGLGAVAFAASALVAQALGAFRRMELATEPGS